MAPTFTVTHAPEPHDMEHEYCSSLVRKMLHSTAHMDAETTYDRHHVTTLRRGRLNGNELLSPTDAARRPLIRTNLAVPSTLLLYRDITTETDFFERADMLDTNVGQGKKDDPADVARVGFDAMMRGDGDVVSGWKNKLQSAIANITPAGVLAEQHRRMAEPRSAKGNQ
jgi:hypothetical protein